MCLFNDLSSLNAFMQAGHTDCASHVLSEARFMKVVPSVSSVLKTEQPL
jgi:hypothetical protein